MHIEKNICESLVGTLLNIDGKIKDTIKARQDLKDMGIQKELHLKPQSNGYLKPHPCYSLTLKERRNFANS